LFWQFEEPGFEVARQGHLEAERLASDGVYEGQRGGVEGLAGGTARFRQRRVADFVGIDFLAAEAVSDFGEMNANLVSAAGFEAAFEDGVVAQLFEGADVGDGAAGL
jgi:hypothetical protein